MTATPEQILVGLGVILALWYLLASIYNRRRGLAAYRWLRDGLTVLSQKYEGKWLGSAAAGGHLTIAQASSPFRRVEVIFLLESRELLPLWLFDLLRGKRDQIIFKATLRAARQADVEIAPAGSRLARRIQGRIDDSWTTITQDGLFIAGRGRDVTAVLSALNPVLTTYGPYLRHLSWSTSRPNLIIIFNMIGLLHSGDNAGELFTTIRHGWRPNDSATGG
jgi:hypothetical protein